MLDLAAVFNTLIADHDGVYDPRLYNDRLLLGLKGTMSEAELHLLKMRMEEGRMRQVERGELRQGLPTGLQRLPNNQVVKDPDDQVRHTLEMVFSKFEELGSCRKVLADFRKNKVSLPAASDLLGHTSVKSFGSPLPGKRYCPFCITQPMRVRLCSGKRIVTRDA